MGRATGGQVHARRGAGRRTASVDAASTMRRRPPMRRHRRGPGAVRRIPQSEPAEPPKPRPAPARGAAPGAVARQRQGAGAAQRFDQHDDHQVGGAYGDQHRRARGVEGDIRQRPQQRHPGQHRSRRAGIAGEIGVQASTTRVPSMSSWPSPQKTSQKNVEAAGLVGRQGHARLLVWHDVGAQAEVRHLEAVDAVFGGQHAGRPAGRAWP